MSMVALQSIDKADTAWVLVATAMVLMMTLPGLALFYAGLVRKKNVVNTLMSVFAIACVVTLLWFAVGYSLAFTAGSSWLGGLGRAGFAALRFDLQGGQLSVSHLAPHLSVITLRPEFFDVYLELAVEFRLPIRLPSTITAEQAGFPFRRLAAEEGVLFPDHFNHDWRAGSRERVYDAIRTLQPGVTEIHVQPVIDTPEVRAITSSAELWIDDHELVTSDATLRTLLHESGATPIGYRSLRDAMRAG